MWGERGVHPLDGKEFGETSETVATTEHAGIIVDFAGGNGRVVFDAVDCGEEGVLIGFAVGQAGEQRLASRIDIADEVRGRIGRRRGDLGPGRGARGGDGAGSCGVLCAPGGAGRL